MKRIKNNRYPTVIPGTAEASLSRIVRRRSSNTGGYVLNPPSQINNCGASPMRMIVHTSCYNPFQLIFTNSNS